MQIALTRKLADAAGVNLTASFSEADPLFAWTANWTNTFNRRKEDMVIMVNNATRFTVSIFGIKRNQLQKLKSSMTAAIRNTLYAMNLNPEVVEEYMRQAGDPEFTPNHDRKLTAWVNRQGLDAAFIVGNAVNESAEEMKFNDTLGRKVSRNIVNYSGKGAVSFVPAEEMIKALAQLTGKSPFRYRAFELLVTLDLRIYKATRRVIVPADIEFTQLHQLLQQLYKWENCHLHAFRFPNSGDGLPAVRLVMSEEDRSYDAEAIVETGRKLSEYFPRYKRLIYTYDMGDSCEHSVDLVREIDNYQKESPYLLEASGQAPPEDVGGVPGFLDFRDIMLNPKHPEYEYLKKWSWYWSPELHDGEMKPKVIPI
jgi:hypothetical protein